jgi:two-component system NtrC family sensor kinase
MTALPQDEVADLSRLVAELEQRLESSFVVYDQAIAQQVVLAQENARLQSELATARDREAAGAEILRTISEASGDPEHSLQQIAETTASLFGASSVRIRLAEDGEWGRSFHVGRSSDAILAAVPDAQRRIGGHNLPGTVVAENRQIHIGDLDHIGPEMADWPGLPVARAAGARTVSGTPLRRDGRAIGVLIIHRDMLMPFSEAELALQQSFADQAAIAVENARLFNETQEALERQTATSDILKVIASSPSDVQPVFDALVNSAAKLFGPCGATITTVKDGKLYWNATGTSLPDFDFKRAKEVYPIPLDPDRSPSARAILERRIIEIPDVDTPDTPDFTRQAATAGGFRSITFVPLINQGKGIGTIILNHPQAGFRLSEHQLALVQTFADQAVIAIENARLFNETREALERQTATADILKVIASSPSDVQPVFDAIAASANRLIAGFSTTVFRFIDGTMHLKAFTHTSAAGDEMLQSLFPRPLAGFPIFELVSEGETAQFADTEAESVPLEMRDLARSRGFRSMLFTPLMSGGVSIGMIGITRPEPGAFDDRHVQLLQTFADQAVIAIENVRLFDEVQARTRDLSESLQQQTATADVLKVISRSTFDLQTVLETLIKSAVELSGAYRGSIFLREGDVFPLKAASSTTPEFLAYWAAHPPRAGRGSATERVIASGKVEEIPDVHTDPEMQMTAGALANIRATLGVPMLRDNKVEGVLVLTRPEPGHFSKSQIDLVQTFADQAVIAVENVRLFDETQARTRDLSEALTHQTGSSSILTVIAQSPTDVEPVLKAIAKSACEVCGAHDAIVRLIADDTLRLSAHHGPIPASTGDSTINRSWTAGRSVIDRKPIHVHDMLSGEGDQYPEAQQRARQRGHRTILSVPLLREDECIGVITVRRQEVKPFSDKQISLLETFANQAVIAIGNARLFEQLQARTKELAASLEELRTAQDRLVQTEKLASLGQLTAGIAHEIKNPLNFVNNFSSLSAELTDELNDVLKTADLADKVRSEVDELTGLLKDNLQKVVQHGKRADSIVKNMLLHSREGTGDHRPADINALLDESLNLAYHGARAEKPQFNVTLQRDFDPNAGTAIVFPQEITRVLLNLIGNGFYAVAKRKADGAEGFDPVVRAATKDLGDHVEIRIRDNGTGIPPDVKEKMFNPFFTTKPAGEGTGLGLSMSHDIIVKQHGGTIDVDTEPGAFTEFTVRLPRIGQIANKK